MAIYEEDSPESIQCCNWVPKRLRNKRRVHKPRSKASKVEMSSGPLVTIADDGYLYVHKHKGETKFVRRDEIITKYGKCIVELEEVFQCGQVQSHSTGNKPTSGYIYGQGNTINNINYYGSDHSQAYNPSQQSMDPEKFTKPATEIVGTLAGPTLKSPNVEEAGYSDRIQQLVSGNSCITSQEAAKAIVAYGMYPSYNIDAGEALDLDTKPGPSCDRFYTFDALSWGSTEYGEWALPLPGGLSDMGVFGQNLKFHYLYRSGFCVNVQCNASKFHQGMLLVAMVPEHQTPTQLANGWAYREGEKYCGKQYPTEQLTLFPHQFINLRTNNSATIIYPYTNVTPASFGLAHNFVTLIVRVVVPLSYNTGASTQVPITVSVAPMCSCFAGLRGSVDRQGLPMREIPGSMQFLSMQRDAGIPVYPEFEKTHGFRLPGRVTNFLEVARVGTIVAMQSTSNQSSQLYYTLDLTQNIQTTVLQTIDVSLLSDQMQTTYLSRLAKQYANYRGSILLEFIFCGSQMATGKLLIAYTPPGGSRPTTRQEASLGTNIIWDLGLQSTCKFPIPYISSSQYRQTNVRETILSYNGWVTIWYQTAIVVPPGAPSTCQLVCLASASDNFVFRIPSDNDYYNRTAQAQGEGDKILESLNAHVSTTVQNALHTRPQEEVSTNGVEIQQGDAPALTAAETGETSDQHGEGCMELRATNMIFSTKETDLEYLMSRYFLFWEYQFDLTKDASEESKKLMGSKVVNFSGISETGAATTRWKAFTYWRFDLDFVFIGFMDLRTATTPQAIAMQAMFSPVGCTAPKSFKDSRWKSPINPSLIFRTDHPPASFRIPFMSICNYYSTAYDGDGKFDAQSRAYGINPGNDIGTLSVKVANSERPGFDGKFIVRVYARPVNIEAYMPRPLNIYNDDGEVIPSSSRYWASQLGFQYGVDIKSDIGDMWDVNDLDFVNMSSTDYLLERCYDVLSFSAQFDKGPFTAWWWKDDIIITSYHACNDWYAFLERKNPVFRYWISSSTKMWWKNRYMVEAVGVKQVWIDSFRDIAFIRVADGNRVHSRPGLLGENRVRHKNERKFEHCLCVTNSVVFPVRYTEYRNPQYCEILNFKDHQQKDLWSCRGDAEPGFCGSMLFSNGKAIGILTAKSMCTYDNGDKCMTTFFTQLDTASLYRCVEVTKKDCFYACVHEPATQCGLEDPFGANTGYPDDLEEDIPLTFPEAHYQGLYDWIHDMGISFGDGAGESFQRNVDEAIDKITPILNNLKGGVEGFLKDTVFQSMFKLLVKVIGALVIYINAKDDSKLSTLLALGSMLGVDFLSVDPFTYLADKFSGCVGMQGPSDWLKDFNIACNAFKGLEYIYSKLSVFFDWLKSTLYKYKDPAREEFHRMLEDWPEVMEKMDLIERNRKNYNDADILEVCEFVVTLKKLADTYGVERNLATTQIIKYHAKAQKLTQSIRSSRYEPVALCIHGSPGTGKSVATEIIARALSQKTDAQQPYSLPPDPKYFDGYSQQNVVIMDDLGQNPDGEDMSLFCQMVSTTAFIPPMASLEEKGTYFTSNFVCASTNCTTLKPPTIMEPAALARRFYLDCDIIVNKDYQLDRKLDMSKCTPCLNCPKPENFKACNPLICGKAILLRDRKTDVRYNLDKVVTAMVAESRRRRSILNVVDALFQGPSYEKPKLIRKQVVERMLPSEVVEVLKELPSEELILKLKEKGYIMPIEVEIVREKSKVQKYLNWFSTIISGITTIISLSTVVYMLVSVFAGKQGAYSGNIKPVVQKPVLRKAVVQGPDLEFAKSLCKSSLFPVCTSTGSYTALGLYDQWLLLPAHSCPKDNIVMNGDSFKILDSILLESSKGNLELVVIKIDRNEKFRDIRKYLVDNFHTEKDCWLALNSDQFRDVYIPVGSVSLFGFLNLSMTPTYNTLKYNYPTKVGQCGGVIVKAGKILGMHIGGDGVSGYAAMLKKSYFSVCQGEIVYKESTKERGVKSINVKTKTGLYPSVFHDVFEGTKEPAALRPGDSRLKVDLNEALFSKYKGNKHISIPPETFIAIDHYVEQIRPLLPENLTEQLELEDVVYGIENLEGLDLNTSAGYPYNTMGIRKRDLIPPRGEPLTQLQKALDLHGYDLPFSTYLKDELRPKAKVEAGKTRLIECSSLNDTIRMKRIFGRLFQIFHSNPGTCTGSAVGCNPDYHWSQFASEIGMDNICAFDYTNWDASLSPFWFDALKVFLVKLGYGEGAIDAIDHICYSSHIFKDQYYVVHGGMPSGCSGTSIFNSIINNLVVRTLVLKCYKGINLDLLRILAYGDDLLVSYPFPLDPAVLADAGKELGLTMTPADKSDSFNGCSKLTEVTFLKRSFVFDEQFPFLCHPVFPMSEIHESIRWTRSAATTQEHVTSLCLLAWHNGKEVYEEFCEKIRSTPVGRALSLPSFEVLRYNWLDLF
ncbi:polyprotein [simian sapelovirus 2]|uniref:Genome polyprotein n=1 Tax=simian sapelovirus 2 TaxID=544573 RepID=B5A1N0_9PICO|nr:polyprotein [Simian sapelovirus 2]